MCQDGENKMDFHQRLSSFISNNYESNIFYSNFIKIDSTQLNKYTKGRHYPSFETLIKFYESGVSLDWLLSGDGSMFAENEKGNELKVKYETKNKGIILEIKSRIRKWILDNYKTFENFGVENDMDTEELMSELESLSYPKPQLLYKLKLAGCNIKWAVGGKGEPYLNNPRGFILKSRKKTDSKKELDLKSEDLNLFFIKLKKTIKKIIKDELK